MRPLFRPVLASLLTVRTTVILAVACVSGAAVGALTYLASHSLPQALLAAGTATSGSAHLLGRALGTDPERPASSKDDDQNDSTGQREA